MRAEGERAQVERGRTGCEIDEVDVWTEGRWMEEVNRDGVIQRDRERERDLKEENINTQKAGKGTDGKD